MPSVIYRDPKIKINAVVYKDTTVRVKKLKVGTPIKRVTAGAFSIDNLGGVDPTGKTAGSILAYNAATTKWSTTNFATGNNISITFDSAANTFTFGTNAALTNVTSLDATTTSTVRGVLSVTDAGGDGSLAYNNSTGVVTYTGPSASEVRAHITANKGLNISSGELNIDSANVKGMFSASGDLSYNSGTGQFSFDVESVYTKANFDSDLGLANTGQLPEGSNLYYTDARADARITTAAVTATGALMDSELTDLAGVKGVTISTLQPKPSEGAFVNGDKTKLDGIETGATADQTDAEIKTAYENNSDTNAFTDAEKTKLTNIEASADVTDTANVTSAGALMDSELTDLAGVKGVTISTLQPKPSEGAFANGDKTKLDGIEASADVTDTANVTSAGALMDSELTDLAGVKGVTISTLQVKPSEGAFADGDKTKLDAIEASADVTDTANVTAAGALMDSELTDLAGVKGVTISTLQVKPSEGAFANGDKTKLDGIEASADVTDTANVTSAGALMDSELTSIADVKALDQSVISGASPNFTTTNMSDATNKRFMTDAQESKLDGIEASATADQTDAEIRAAVEAATDSNVFTDADHSKLNAIEASADVTDTANVTAAGALMDSEVDADIKTLSLPANTTISAFGKTLVDDADAATARTTLGVDASGTDNSTNVTLAGSLDYITISAQEITRNAINLSTDVTGILPVGNMAATALTTVQTAANESAHLALTAQEGDVVVRSDQNKTYMHNGGSAGTMGDYTLLATPTDAVTSVNGNTGVVTVTENVTTNLTITGTDAARTIVSSDGTDAVIPVATDSVSGVMSAADHTKLSGIETSADVTDTANVTSAGALMDSEVTNLAQVKAFDASDYATSAQGTKADSALQNVVEDTSPQLGANLDLNSNNITGTGDISTTGDFTLTDTTSGSAAGPEFTLHRDITGADANYLGQIKFTADNDADQNTVFAKITGKIDDASDGTEDGLIEFALKKAGSNNIGVRLTSTDLKLINGTGLEVAGNITVTGTVDGRDVATDGTKLDGIEASADVTDTTNVTAAGALMDSELTDLAGVKGVTISTLQPKPSEGAFANGDKTKLDAIEASADVTDTANVTAAGALMDSELTDLAGVKGVTISTLQVKPSEGAFADGDKTKLDAIEASADVTDTANVTAAGALMDSELTDLAGVKGVTISTLQPKPSEGAFANGDKTKLDGIEASADVTDTANVTSAGALMDSELASIADVKALDQSVVSGASPTFGTANFTDASNKRFMSDAQESKLDGIEASADVTDATNVTAAGALMDSELTSIADVKALDQSVVSGASPNFATTNMTDASNKRFMTDAQETKLDSVESSADVTDATNVTAAGALMDSELASIADVKALDQSVVSGASPTFGTANMTDASNKRFMTDAQETKLDSVESSATADQSAAEILTAIKTVDGSGSGLDADLLDGVQGSSYLRSDANDTYTGNLTVAGKIGVGDADTVADHELHIQSASPTIRLEDTDGNQRFDITQNAGSTNVDYETDILFKKSDGTEIFRIDGAGVDVTGEVTITSHLDMPDNANIKLGTSDDLEIYHDGSNSYITEGGTGILFLRTNQLQIQSDDGLETYATFTDNGAVNLYHDNSTKLATTSTGISVTGNVEFDGLSGTGAVTVTDILDEDDMSTNSATMLATQQSIKAYVDANAGSMSDAQVRAAVEAATDSNVFTDADHSKLNGIEASATADQTAAEILTAIKTVDGSGSGLDADVLDGIGSGSFLRSDTADAVNAYTTQITFPSNTSGGTASGNQASLQVYQGTANADAFITFHVAGDFAAYFGIDGTTNDLFVGGWTMGANKYKIWHQNNDGSGSGLDADTLDGVQGASYLRSDANDTYTGDLTVTGTIALSSHLDMPDAAQIKIGTGDDLLIYQDGVASIIKHNTSGQLFFMGDDIRFVNQANNNAIMYLIGDVVQFYGNSTRPDGTHSYFGTGNDIDIVHDGSNSWIRDIGTGDLYLDTNSGVHLYANGNTEMLYAQPGGGVHLYHVGAEKLKTTTSGIEVTGSLDVNGSADFVGDIEIQATTGYAHMEMGGPSGAFIDLKKPFSDDYDFRIMYDDTASLKTPGNYVSISTASGYVHIGPQNTSYSHFSTDRAKFYFNKQINVDTGIITSHNEDLKLQRAGSSTNQLLYADGLATFGTEVSMPTLRLTSGGDASLSSTAHVLQLGPTSGTNMAIDGNEILARNNGAASTLILQNDGGNLSACAGGGTTTLGGQLAMGGNDIDNAANIYLGNVLYHHGDTNTYLQFHAADSFQIVAGGSQKMITTTTNTTFTTDITVADQIMHEGDTNTYMQFHAADQWRVVTGGNERLEVNNTATTVNQELRGLGHINLKSDSTTATRYVHMPRGGGVTFYGDGNVNHSITSRNISGTAADDILIAAYGSVLVKLDSNNNQTAGANFRIYANGSSTLLFDVDGEDGDVVAAGDVTAFSDVRLKENIKVIPNALEKVSKIRGVTFTRNDKNNKEKVYTGVIAQEVEKVLPEVVNTSDEDIKTVAYGNMVGLLIEAVKEQQEQINELKKQIEEMK